MNSISYCAAATPPRWIYRTNVMISTPTPGITTSQTIGPFSHEAWRWAVDATAKVDSGLPTIHISGAIRDGDGKAIDDAVSEAWLPNAAGAESRHAIPGFRRVSSDEVGAFRFEVSMPT